MIGMAYVNLNEAAKRNVNKALDDGHLARGPFLEQFEEMVAEFTGTKYAVAMCNGTLADVIALQAAKELRGHQVAVMPALTFAAQLSAVLSAGMTPRFVGIDANFDMLHGQVNSAMTDRTGNPLLFATSLLGVKTNEYSDIVDSCETFARNIGKNAWATTCSFYVTHAVGIGEGGAVVTDDPDFCDVCMSLRDHGQVPGGPLVKFKHKRAGHNAKLSNVLAAIGCGMMQEADEIIAKRCQVAKWYDQRFGGKWGELMISPHGYPVECPPGGVRDEMLSRLTSHGIEARRVFSVLPQEPAFLHLGMWHQRFPFAERIAERWLYLPCHQGLTESDVDWIFDGFKELLGE